MAKIYDTKRWKKLRLYKLFEDPICQYCNKSAATEVDHRIAVENGGDPFEYENLMSACKACHSRKTYYVEILGRKTIPIKGCTDSGDPLDPDHWWNDGTTRAESEK
jgi:5-methylcytosine-specific restriction endonuclease McrA